MKELKEIELMKSYYRGFATRKDLKTKKQAATKIQSNYRGFKARKQISEDMDSGAYGAKKKKKKGVKYVWNKMKHCWTKVTGGHSDKDDKKHHEEETHDSELWDLSQKHDLPDGTEISVESEEDVDGYKIPVKKGGKPLTLLQLNAVYEKKAAQEPDKPKEDPLVKYGAPIKSPYQSAYGSDVSPYAEYKEDEEASVPRKPHKVIKYKPPGEDDKPKPKPQEETGFFSSMFRTKETEPVKTDGVDGEKKDENILGQMGGKFMGLFGAKAAEEKPKEVTKEGESESPGDEKKDEVKVESQGVGDKFLGLFSGKPAEPPKEEEKLMAETKPQEESKPPEEAGLFGKFTGFFKPKTEEKPSVTTPGTQSETTPLTQSETKPLTQAETKPEAEVKAEVTIAAETAPEVKSEVTENKPAKEKIPVEDKSDQASTISEVYPSSPVVDYSEVELCSDPNPSVSSYPETDPVEDYPSTDQDGNYSERDHTDMDYTDQDTTYRSESEYSYGDDPAYSDEYSDDEADGESRTKREFQAKFMAFLKKDAEEHDRAEPTPRDRQSVKKTGSVLSTDSQQTTTSSAISSDQHEEEPHFFSKMFKKEEAPKLAAPPPHVEQSGMGKMFGGFFKKT